MAPLAQGSGPHSGNIPHGPALSSSDFLVTFEGFHLPLLQSLSLLWSSPPGPFLQQQIPAKLEAGCSGEGDGKEADAFLLGLLPKSLFSE